MTDLPRTINEHHKNVGALRCVVTGNPQVTLHHVHGGSVAEAGYHTGTASRGVGEALVIPLKDDYHTGDFGVDSGLGVLTWELYFGTQMDHLRYVGEQLGYDIFRLNRVWKEHPPIRG